MAQRINWHLHVDSYYGANVCQFTSAGNGSIASPSGEDNFGQYHEINPLHRCSSANDATTQWWFGEQQILSSKRNRLLSSTRDIKLII